MGVWLSREGVLYQRWPRHKALHRDGGMCQPPLCIHVPVEAHSASQRGAVTSRLQQADGRPTAAAVGFLQALALTHIAPAPPHPTLPQILPPPPPARPQPHPTTPSSSSLGYPCPTASPRLCREPWSWPWKPLNPEPPPPPPTSLILWPHCASALRISSTVIVPLLSASIDLNSSLRPAFAIRGVMR